MPKRVKRYGLALVGAGVAVGVIAPAVIAAGTDTDDFIQPASTLVQASLGRGTVTKFVFTVGPATLSLICTASSTSGTTPAHGLKMAVGPMSFTGNCSDNLGGRDFYTTSGVWHVTFHDAANDEADEAPPRGCSTPPCITPPPPPPPDKLVITVPIKGITITTSISPTCVVTVAPTAPAPIVGTYNDVNTLTITNAAVPFKYAATGTPGCPGGNGSGTGNFSATYVLTPGVHDAS